MAIPEPEVGLIISYSYLWHWEHGVSQDEGRKDRPSVIIFAVERESDGALLVTVLPITHRAPEIEAAAVEIPFVIKAHLGMDAERSWVVLNEGNEFIWPGFDLRRIAKSSLYDYGSLPPRFFKRVQIAFSAWHKKMGSSIIPRM